MHMCEYISRQSFYHSLGLQGLQTWFFLFPFLIPFIFSLPSRQYKSEKKITLDQREPVTSLFHISKTKLRCDRKMLARIEHLFSQYWLQFTRILSKSHLLLENSQVAINCICKYPPSGYKRSTSSVYEDPDFVIRPLSVPEDASCKQHNTASRAWNILQKTEGCLSPSCLPYSDITPRMLASCSNLVTHADTFCLANDSSSAMLILTQIPLWLSMEIQDRALHEMIPAIT